MSLTPLKTKFDSYSIHDKWYKIGAFSIVFYFFLLFIITIFFDKTYIQPLTDVFIFCISIIAGIAVALEYWKKIGYWYSKTWFKLIGGSISFLVYKYSELHADDFINNFTFNEPSYFPMGASILTTFFLLYSWLLMVSIILMSFSVYITAFNRIFRHSESEDNLKPIVRFIGIIVIAMSALQTTKIFEDKDSILYTMATHLVINTEYFKNTHCQNIKDNELSAYLDRGYISMFSTETGIFRTEMCELGN